MNFILWQYLSFYFYLFIYCRSLKMNTAIWKYLIVLSVLHFVLFNAPFKIAVFGHTSRDLPTIPAFANFSWVTGMEVLVRLFSLPYFWVKKLSPQQCLSSALFIYLSVVIGSTTIIFILHLYTLSDQRSDLFIWLVLHFPCWRVEWFQNLGQISGASAWHFYLSFKLLLHLMQVWFWSFITLFCFILCTSWYCCWSILVFCLEDSPRLSLWLPY